MPLVIETYFIFNFLCLNLDFFLNSDLSSDINFQLQEKNL